MERMRKKSLLITRIVLYSSLSWFAVSLVFLLFHPNKWLGLAFGIISLFGISGAVGVHMEYIANANTQRILKAIEVLRQHQ